MSKHWLAAGFLVASVSAWATTLIALDVPGLTQASDVVLRGRVTKVEPQWSGDKARIFTVAHIDVLQAIKGDGGKVAQVTQPGGEIGDVGQHVAGVATFTVGEEVVLFLERRGPFFTVTGMVQGKFTVERSSDGKAAFARQADEFDALLLDATTRQPTTTRSQSMSLDALIALVRRSVGPTPDDAPAKPVPTLPTPTPAVKK